MMTPRPGPPDPPDDLPDRLRRVVVQLGRRLRRESGTDISPTQYSALIVIGRDGPLTLGELAEAEAIRPPTATAAVGRLEAQGLVVRRRDDDDRRIVRVEATAAGKRLLARVRDRRSAYLARLLRDLAPEDRAAVARAVEVLGDLL